MKRFFLCLSLFVAMSALSMATYAQNEGAAFQSNDITPPKYIGGDEEMFAFLDSVLVVPQSALEDNVSGRVIVRFFVDKDGNIKSPSVQQGLTPDCNRAAIEAVKKMTRWEPATQNGKSVTGFASVPVSFKTKQVVYEYEPTEAELTYDTYVLPDKKWVLVKIGDKNCPDNLPNTPYFIMTTDKKKKRIVEGNASCGDFTARWNWNMKNYRLTFSKVELKKKKCKGKDTKVIDGDVINVLKKTKVFRIAKDGSLMVGYKEKNRFIPLATFQSEPLKKK